MLLTTALTGSLLVGYILSRHSLVRARLTRLRAALFSDILRVGAVGSISTFQTTLTVALTTALVGAAAGPDAVAGYGTGSRLEYLLIPLVFGLGAPLVALVGTNIGAGQGPRALRAALIGGAVAFGMTETIGLAAAIWPTAWLGLFDSNPRMLETGAAYLRMVGPAYGFFGLGLCLYFASQGAGRLLWPLLAGLIRMVLAVGGGWLALWLTGSLSWVFAALGLALVVYGSSLASAIASGVWFGKAARRRQPLDGRSWLPTFWRGIEAVGDRPGTAGAESSPPCLTGVSPAAGCPAPGQRCARIRRASPAADGGAAPTPDRRHHRR